jgi:glycosyltransferase involved in cell wall biosynthesis
VRLTANQSQNSGVPLFKLNVAVCGRFHFHNYVRYLDQAGLLNRFYYSHKRSTDAANLEIRSDRAINLWAKEYLVHLHGKLTKGRLLAELSPFYTDLWQLGALRRWDRCDILHLMQHGTGLSLIRRAKSEGATVIAEPVNQHPLVMNAILNEETERLGLKRTAQLYRAQERQIEESLASDFLLAPSRIVRDSFVDRGYRARRTAVLPYGVDLNRFHPGVEQDKLDKTFRVICVGAISPRKGQVYLLETWKKLNLPSAELLLIGSISHEMTSIVHRYDGLFRHIPFVPNHELFEYYSRSSVFVLPSLEDGCSVACAEAMACGLPVITTSNNGASDIIDHGKDGFVVAARSPEAIAEHIEAIYRDRELRHAMSMAALAKARNELGWDRYAKRLCDFYRSVLEHKRQAPSPGEDRTAKAS